MQAAPSGSPPGALAHVGGSLEVAGPGNDPVPFLDHLGFWATPLPVEHSGKWAKPRALWLRSPGATDDGPSYTPASVQRQENHPVTAKLILPSAVGETQVQREKVTWPSSHRCEWQTDAQGSASCSGVLSVPP